jgi:membrane protein implicated in regulation of membrane protease activity
VREEAFLFVGLMVCLAGIGLTRESQHIESLIWMSLLALQSVPYLAAMICAALSVVPVGIGENWRRRSIRASDANNRTDKIAQGRPANAARVSSL